MAYVALGLGSNRSFNGLSPVDLLERACARLSVLLGDMRLSSIYKTAALYVTEQDDFYNMAVAGSYSGTPRGLLEQIHAIEADYGRDRRKEFRNGPRPLDIDIEFFGDERISEPDLVIPHERLLERAFVLVPLLDILSENADVDKSRVVRYRNALRRLDAQRIELYKDKTELRWRR